MVDGVRKHKKGYNPKTWVFEENFDSDFHNEWIEEHSWEIYGAYFRCVRWWVKHRNFNNFQYVVFRFKPKNARNPRSLQLLWMNCEKNLENYWQNNKTLVYFQINKVMMYKACKYRLYPNKSQEELILKHIGCCRYIYNYGLEKKIKV